MLLSLVLFFILLGTYIQFFNDVYSYWKKKRVVGPRPWPIVGNYGQVLFGLKSENQVIRELYDAYPEAKCIGIFIGTKPGLILRDLQMMRQVYSKDFKNFPARIGSVAFQNLTKSLFVASADEHWHYNRKKITPLLNQKRISIIINAIETSSKNFLDYEEKLVAKTPKQNVCKLKEMYIFVILCDAILDKNYYGSYDKKSKLLTRLRLLSKFQLWQFRHCLELIFPCVFQCLKHILQGLAALFLNYILETMHAALDKQKLYKHKINTTYSNLILEWQEDKRKNGVKLDDDDDSLSIHMTEMMAGLSVSASATASNLCFEWAQNQDIQTKCYEEINEVLRNYNGKLTFESLTHMEYFDLVLEETFRKYGSSLNLNRTCGTKYCFSSTGLEIDPGVIMFAPADAYREDPKYFPNPEKFVPERFAPENKNKIPLGAHLPFGYGPRKCIGESITKLILKISMALFLQRFNVRPSDFTPSKLSYDYKYLSRIPVEDEFWLNMFSRQGQIQ